VIREGMRTAVIRSTWSAISSHL